MIKNKLIDEGDTTFIHMNKVQFDQKVFRVLLIQNTVIFISFIILQKAHQDLHYLNMKQSDTVIIQTNEEIKTDILNCSLSQSNRFKFQNSDIEINDQNSQIQQRILFSRQTQQYDQSQQSNKEDDSKMLNIIQNPFDEKSNFYTFQNGLNLVDSEMNKTKLEMYQSINNSMQNKSAKNPKRLIRAINLLVNVKSFYRLLTKNSRILGKLTKEQHYLINDFSSTFQNKRQQTLKFLYQFPKIKKFIEEMSACLNSIFEFIPIFQPYSIYKFIWDILQALLILSVMFLFSLITFFQMSPQNYIEFFQITFVLFVLDILFTFNTGVVEKGNVIFDRKKAALVYLKKNFIMDQIALLPLFMFFLNIELQGLYSWIIYFQILMKLFVLVDIFDRLTFYLNYQKNMKNIVDLVKLVFIIVCVCHVFCLFWHGLAIYEIKIGFEKTWLQVREIQDADVFTRYVQSFYFLAVTMITVGYGDITPQTTYEILFTTLTMFVSGFFYAFSLNRIGSIIENIELKDKSYKESMQVIHRLMREENVSQTLRVQISNYLQYLYKVNFFHLFLFLFSTEWIILIKLKPKQFQSILLKSEKFNNFKQLKINEFQILKESNEVGKKLEKEIIDKLSKQLKYGLIQEVQGKYLKEIEFIDKLETKSKIVEIMEECLFSPGEYIFQQGDLDDSALYYIVKGSVKIIYEYQDRNQTQSLLITQLNKSQYFGDMQFIQGSARILTAQASDFCRTYKIPRDQFFQCIKQSEYDFEIFQMLKEAYIYKENQKLFQMKCYTCKKTDHISIKCPKTHLTLSKQTLIQKESKTIPHLERKFVERRSQKINCLSLNFEIIDALFQFIDKDENIQNLQQLEEQMNLSYDEAYIEQQLVELQQLDQAEILEQKKNFENTNQKIIEAEQEEEQENYDINIQKNEFGSKKNLKQNSISINNSKNEDDETRSLDDSNSVQSNYSLKGILNQFQRNKQKQLTVEKDETGQSILDQLNNILNQNEQSIYIEPNASACNTTQKQQNNFPQNLNEDCKQKEQFCKNQKSVNQADKNLQKISSIQDSKDKVSSSQSSQIMNAIKKSLSNRKSQSLTNIKDEDDNQQDQQNKQNESKNLFSSNRSQSYDQSSLNQIIQSPNLLTVPKENQQQNILTTKEKKSSPDENLDSNFSSISKIDFSKQILNQFNSQSTVKTPTNYEQTLNKDHSNSHQQQSQLDIKRRQSKKLTLLRQQMLQKRSSQINYPLIQQVYLNYNQNSAEKNQNKFSNQIKQNQEQHVQNILRQRKSLAQNQIQHQLNNLNQNIYQQIIQQVNNSPLIGKRRSYNLCKNLTTINQQQMTRNKIQNSLIFDLESSSRLFPEIHKNRSSFQNDFNLKENCRKLSQQIKLDLNKFLQNNPENNLQSQLQIQQMEQNYLLMQENEYIDLSYLMLQIFDRANIFRFYHPNFNINVVIQNLKQKETKLKFKKSFRSQASRHIQQTKRIRNLSIVNKTNERCIKSNISKISKESEIFKLQV